MSYGCATARVESDLAPGTDLSALSSFYVAKFPSDNRGLEKLIEADLRSRGLEVSSGEAQQPESEADALITYEDRWMWDMTMYLLELKLFIKEPDTDFVIGSGFSYRTSLARKKPEEMVKEVLDKLFATETQTEEEQRDE